MTVINGKEDPIILLSDDYFPTQERCIAGAFRHGILVSIIDTAIVVITEVLTQVVVPNFAIPCQHLEGMQAIVRCGSLSVTGSKPIVRKKPFRKKL